MWAVFLTCSAEKQLDKLPEKEAQKIYKIIESAKANPFVGDVRKLTGLSNMWRYRSGSYRIIFEVSWEDRAIFIYDILRRASNTY